MGFGQRPGALGQVGPISGLLTSSLLQAMSGWGGASGLAREAHLADEKECHLSKRWQQGASALEPQGLCPYSAQDKADETHGWQMMGAGVPPNDTHKLKNPD